MGKAGAATACLIIIGNEILSGRTRDENLPFIGQQCDRLGIALRACQVIPDDAEAIIETINDCRGRFSYVFTTGGIGPTHDDITSAAVARAFAVKLQQHPAAVAVLRAYYAPDGLTAARLKMADVPATARLIDNPVSAAPGFQIENVFVLPGIPMLMQTMFAGITDRLIGGAPMLTHTVTAALPESRLAAGLGELQAAFPEVVIGSYPYYRESGPGVNIVLRHTSTALLAELALQVEKLIQGCMR